jgi:hypothetical protein
VSSFEVDLGTGTVEITCKSFCAVELFSLNCSRCVSRESIFPSANILKARAVELNESG